MTPPLPPLARLYRDHFASVWSALRRLGVPSASLEDAVHDVFMVVHRRRDGFEGRSAARTWILGIARRIAYRYRRSHARTQQRHRALASVPARVLDPDDDMARREAWRALLAFLEELDEDKRAAFVLGELERLNREELGAALGVSPNTAYSRLRAARARFHVRFSDDHRQVLAAGRHAEPAPAESRQRVWVALAGGLSEAAAPAAAVGSAKAWLTMVGLASAVLGLTAIAAPRLRGSEAGAERAPSAAGPGAATHEVADAPGSPSAAAAMDPSPVAIVDPPTATTAMLSEAPPPPLRSSPTATTRSPRRADRAPATPRPTEDLAAEASLLRSARAALESGRPEAALAPLDEHRRRFPRGALAEEREASRIRALCALGRDDDARQGVRALAAEHPRSAYLAALEGSCPTSVINPARGGDPVQ